VNSNKFVVVGEVVGEVEVVVVQEAVVVDLSNPFN
jgi:hypothetical protein